MHVIRRMHASHALTAYRMYAPAHWVLVVDDEDTGSKRKERKCLYDKRNVAAGRKGRPSKVKRLQETRDKVLKSQLSLVGNKAL